MDEPKSDKVVDAKVIGTELEDILDAIEKIPDERGGLTRNQWRKAKLNLKYHRARLYNLVNPSTALPGLVINGPSVEVRGWGKLDERNTRQTAKDRKTKNIMRRR